MRVSRRRMNDLWGRMSLVLLLCALLLRGGLCQDDDAADTTDAADAADADPPADDAADAGDTDAARGDGEPTMAPADDDPQTHVDISPPTSAPAGEAGDETDNTAGTSATEAPDTTADDAAAPDQPGDTAATSGPQAPETDSTPGPAGGDDTAHGDSSQATQVAVTQIQLDLESNTLISLLFPEDQADAKPTQEPVVIVHPADPVVLVQCVQPDAVKDQTRVKIKLGGETDCGIFKDAIEDDFCKDRKFCDVSIAQEGDVWFLSGKTIEENIVAAEKQLKEGQLKDKLNVMSTEPVVVKQGSPVLVSILVTGLLVAAGLIGGYIWMNRRRGNGKGMRLAEDSYPVDEENQGNTLVSVAPLNPPEPQEKPSINGESPDGVKTQAPAATNGHSAKTPVADTEL